MRTNLWGQGVGQVKIEPLSPALLLGDLERWYLGDVRSRDLDQPLMACHHPPPFSALSVSKVGRLKIPQQKRSPATMANTLNSSYSAFVFTDENRTLTPGGSRHYEQSIMLLFSYVVALFVVLIPAMKAGAQSGWQKEWEATLATAEREGEVTIAGPPGDSFREAIVGGFTKRYPKIKVELLGGSGGDKVARILRERQAGVYGWDLYISGPTSALAAFKPVGAFDPLKPALILSEVKSDKEWVGGFESGWADTEQKLFYVFGGTLAGDNIYVNRDLVSAGEIKSARDLLDPKWTGKIIIQDPRVEGKGLTDILVISLAYGEELVGKLLRDQKLGVTHDRRQLVEWLVRGRYPMAMGLNEYVLVQFQKKGVGKNIAAVEDPKTIVYWASGSSGIGLFNRAPHPNAAKIYINWLLSRSGQLDWVKTLTNSRRVDVPPSEPSAAMKPGRSYHNVQAEDMTPQRRRIQQLAKELLQ